MTNKHREAIISIMLEWANDGDGPDVSVAADRIAAILAPSPDPIDAITPTKGETKIFDKIPGETLDQTYERLNPDDKCPVLSLGSLYPAFVAAKQGWTERVLTWANTLHLPEVVGNPIDYTEDGKSLIEWRGPLPGVARGQTVKVALVKVRE